MEFGLGIIMLNSLWELPAAPTLYKILRKPVLHLLNSSFARSVPLREFYRAAWTKNKAPALAAAMTYTNKLTYYLAYAILKETDLKERIKTWSLVAKIGKVHHLKLPLNWIFMTYQRASTS